MHRDRSLERLRASIGSALDLCSQLESGRQNFAHRSRDLHIGRNDISHEVKNTRSNSLDRRAAPVTPSVLRQQTDEVHLFQPAKQDNVVCPQHGGRIIPKGTSDPFQPPNLPTALTSYNATCQMNEANENTNYGSICTRPCPFSPTRACPRHGPCPYATTMYGSTGAFDNTRRPCPYSPTNFCSRGGPCPYMPPPPPPPPPVDDMVCPFVAQMADAINYHSQRASSPLTPSCYRCPPPPPDYRCYSPTVCPLDPRPCVMSPRPCPFKQDVPVSQFATGCPFASAISSARNRTFSEPRKCPYAY